MKKNGFTLVELMAVITILVILSLIIVPIVDKNIKRSKDDMYRVQIENIRMAAEAYYSDNLSLRPYDGGSCFITLEQLISNNYIDENVVNPKTGESFSNLYVEIKNKSNGFEYLVCPIDSGCKAYNSSCS